MLLTPEGVKDRWGVDPEQILDLFALVGDASDNVPGVAGIGKKTAVELILQFGGLDRLYASVDSVSRPSVREKLIAHREEAYLSQELIRLKTDLRIASSIDSYSIPDPPSKGRPSARPPGPGVPPTDRDSGSALEAGRLGRALRDRR